MASTLLENPLDFSHQLHTEPLFADADAEGVRSGGRRLTLDERISGVWEGLRAAGAADCPVCGSRLHRHGDAGNCGDCGLLLT
jgi:hypothetical protein